MLQIDYGNVGSASGFGDATTPVSCYSRQVQTLQLALQEAGFNPGTADGIYGARTSAAVQAFQRARDLPVTNTPTQETLVALGYPAMSRDLQETAGYAATQISEAARCYAAQGETPTPSPEPESSPVREAFFGGEGSWTARLRWYHWLGLAVGGAAIGLGVHAATKKGHR